VIVVDTSIWISHFADILHPEVLRFRAITEWETVLVGDVILMEVLRGARSDAIARRLEIKLAQFDQASMLNPEFAARAADHYRHLRSQGITIRNSADLVVATYCIAHRHDLLHRDRDFDAFERHLGLKVLH
jgi:hypothetical protein